MDSSCHKKHATEILSDSDHSTSVDSPAVGLAIVLLKPLTSLEIAFLLVHGINTVAFILILAAWSPRPSSTQTVATRGEGATSRTSGVNGKTRGADNFPAD